MLRKINRSAIPENKKQKGLQEAIEKLQEQLSSLALDASAKDAIKQEMKFYIDKAKNNTNSR